MKSSKIALKCLFELIKNDTQSVTGFNLRKIMLLVNKSSVDELTPADSKEVSYSPVPDSDKWKIDIVQEITDIKFGVKVLHEYPHEELEEILNFLCTT